MKQLPALIVLFYMASLSHADTMLTFSTQFGQNSHQLSYYIKDGMLRFSEDGSHRINIYDKSKQAFVSIDQGSGTISRIDKQLLAQRVDALTKIRQQKIASAEAELNNIVEAMPGPEQEVAVSVLNQLKYPEFYGAHTRLRALAEKKTRKIAGIECQLYSIRRQDRLLKQICMALPDALGISSDDYHTLREFYRFNYTTQTELLIASGKTGFSYVDYEQHNMPGVTVEISAKVKQPDHANLLLESVSTEPLQASLFAIPKAEK